MTGNPILDHCIEVAKSDPVEGATMLAQSYMAGDPSRGILGYEATPAVAAAARFIPLTPPQVMQVRMALEPNTKES